MADFSRFGADLLPEHFSRFDPKSLTLAARTPGWMVFCFKLETHIKTTDTEHKLQYRSLAQRFYNRCSSSTLAIACWRSWSPGPCVASRACAHACIDARAARTSPHASWRSERVNLVRVRVRVRVS